jgi:bifunctional non-homologous end joining protein LigD
VFFPIRAFLIKLDGYRALAIKNGAQAQLVSRRNNSMSGRFGAIASALEGLEDGIILDGEIVAFDKDGRPSFNMLQHQRLTDKPVFYYVFDLVAYRKRDIRTLPLRQRRELLNAVLVNAGDPIRISAVLQARPEDLIRAVQEHGDPAVHTKLESRADSG